MIPEKHLKSSPNHKSGHPYALDDPSLNEPIPIPKELTEQIAKSKPNDKVASLLKISPAILTQFSILTEKWLRIHSNKNLDLFLKSQNDVEFAKQLFKIWDENDSGKLDLEELTLPLIALGLVDDTVFVQKLMRCLSGQAG
jgi:hypothetical protein